MPNQSSESKQPYRVGDGASEGPLDILACNDHWLVLRDGSGKDIASYRNGADARRASFADMIPKMRKLLAEDQMRDRYTRNVVWEKERDDLLAEVARREAEIGNGE